MSELDYLKAKQDALAEDMGEVKDYLKQMSEAMQVLARLEEKHTNVQSTVSRIHERLDDHETRIRKNEIQLSSQMWIERIIWLSAAAVISAVIAGMI
jgi:predicted nuclease with TOPRIM domain